MSICTAPHTKEAITESRPSINQIVALKGVPEAF